MDTKISSPVLACAVWMVGMPQQSGGVPVWLWVLIILAIILVLIFLVPWLVRRGRDTQAKPAASVMQPVTEAPLPAAPAVEPEEAPLTPDNLEIVEGIGPKIASILRANGILTFSQLASTKIERLQALMQGAGLRLADPGTWPEQARLAAEGKMDELKTLQDQLKGGRTV